MIHRLKFDTRSLIRQAGFEALAEALTALGFQNIDAAVIETAHQDWLNMRSDDTPMNQIIEQAFVAHTSVFGEMGR